MHSLDQERSQVGFNVLDFVQRYQMWLQMPQESEADAVAVAEPQRVNLMTVHGAKGLQFDYVFLPFIGRAQRMNRPRHLWVDDEERQFAIQMRDSISKEIVSGPSLLQLREKFP